MKKRNKAKERKIALQKVKTLFALAERIIKKDAKQAHDYIKIANKTAMKVNLRLPKEFKRKFCKHCHHYLVPGFNCRIRTRNRHVVYSCLDCGKYMRFPYVREKKEKTKKYLNNPSL
ncbi:ribonuclease P [archaeon]|nr:ribonuclease P [archaeon]